MRQPPVKYLVVIESGGPVVAQLFDDQRRLVNEFDAASEEVSVMTRGLVPEQSGSDPAWSEALQGHTADERQNARVYTLDV